MNVIKRENYRVVVEPYLWCGETEFTPRDCEHIVDQIKRHVDDISDAYVDYDTSEVCAFCGADWELLPTDCRWPDVRGYPNCCNKAQDFHGLYLMAIEYPKWRNQ